MRHMFEVGPQVGRIGPSRLKMRGTSPILRKFRLRFSRMCRQKVLLPRPDQTLAKHSPGKRSGRHQSLRSVSFNLNFVNEIADFLFLIDFLSGTLFISCFQFLFVF